MHFPRVASLTSCVLALSPSVLSLSLPGNSPLAARTGCDPLNQDDVTKWQTGAIAVYGQPPSLLGYLDKGTSGADGTVFYLTNLPSQIGNFSFATCDGQVYVGSCIVGHVLRIKF